jgi:hypothetical protein
MNEILIEKWDNLVPIEKYEIANKYNFNPHNVDLNVLNNIKNELLCITN